MIGWAVVTVLVLGVGGLLPALAAVGIRPSLVFAAPLAGALLAALAGIATYAFAGNPLEWWSLLAAGANVAAIFVLRRRGWRPRLAGGWTPVAALVTVAAVGLVTVWPLLGLREAGLGWDAQSIWLLHARLIFAGHAAAVDSLTNPAYNFSHTGYPVLLPSSVAFGWLMEGRIDYRSAQVLIGVLNGCALALVGTLVAECAPRRTRRPAAVLGAGTTIAMFSVAGVGAVDGYADTFAAAAAVAAVLAGLVARRSRSLLALAVLAAWAAGSTKNEGFTVAAIVLALVALRYTRPDTFKVRLWAARAGAGTAVLVAPLLVWPLLVVAHGGSVPSFRGSGAFTNGTHNRVIRLHATAVAVWHQLGWLPLTVLLVAVAGTLLLRQTRARLGLAPPAWLWLALVLGTLALSSVYVVVTLLNVHWWLQSAGRTMQFPRMLLYGELAVWAVVALTHESAQRLADRAEAMAGEPPALERGSQPPAEVAGGG